jgi:6-phospho-3-hexuloisomerase
MSSIALEIETFAKNSQLIVRELERTLAAVDNDEVLQAQRVILAARRVFVAGAGRSGLALKMAAMRLMHLGLTVHVAGEITTPAIAAGDILIVVSGSGTTAGAVHAADVATKAGATVLAITADRSSRLSYHATNIVLIPAATKQDHRGNVSEQYAGALFEQSALLLMDAIFQALWHQRGESAQQLWTRHANLE